MHGAHVQHAHVRTYFSRCLDTLGTLTFWLKAYKRLCMSSDWCTRLPVLSFIKQVIVNALSNPLVHVSPSYSGSTEAILIPELQDRTNLRLSAVVLP